MNYTYKRSEPTLWTVGHYDPAGRWEAESDHGTADEAAARVHWLNGGTAHQEPDPATDGPMDQWAILELMGHRRAAGRIREVTLAGAGMLRLDIPATEGHGPQTQYISPASLYALHPTTEAIATAMAARWRPEPVSRFELERVPPATPIETGSAPADWTTEEPDPFAEGRLDAAENGPF